MTKISKIVALTALIILAFGMTAIGNAEADEEKNKTIVKRNIEEIWNKGNIAVVDEILATNYIRHLPGGKEIRGREAYREYVKRYYNTFPDLRFTIEDLITAGDYVVLRWSCVGTHTGEAMGPPTGKKFKLTGIVIYRLAGGKMAEDWSEFDRLVLMNQLGYKLVPPGGE